MAFSRVFQENQPEFSFQRRVFNESQPVSMFAWIANLLGITICALVALQMILYVLRSWFGLVSDARANRLRIERLNSEIELLRQKHAVEKTSTEGWEGFRKFRVDRLVAECDSVRSIYLVPHDGKTLPAFHPGQYLTFQLRIPDQPKPVVRCYFAF